MDDNATDRKLQSLLRGARPVAELPPGFQNNVWRRIETQPQPAPSMLDWLAGWLLTPRVVAAGLAAVVLLAAGAGALRGAHIGAREARERYIASVDPSYLDR